MAVPDFQSLMLPVLRATANGEIDSGALRDRVAGDFNLSGQDLAEMLPSGRQTKFANRTAWANIFLQRAGLIEKARRGVYRITEAGCTVLAENPPRIDMKFLERFPQYVEWRQSSRAASGEESGEAPDEVGGTRSIATPEEQIDSSFRALTDALESDVLDRVREMPAIAFEGLIVDLLIAMGYGGGKADMGKAVGRSGDGGIDGIIKEDPLGLDIVYIQAKRYAENSNVQRQEVQSFAGSLDGVGATKGIFVTTSAFSKGAREYAARISKRLILIDGGELARLMVRHNVGVRLRAKYEIKKVDEDYFSE